MGDVRTRALQADQHVGGRVLEALVAADLATEGGAGVEVVDHHVQHAGDAACGLGGCQQQGGAVDGPQRGAGGAAGDQRIGRQRGAVERQAVAAPGLVDDRFALQRTGGQAGGGQHGHRGRAVQQHRHQQQVCHGGVGHQGFGAGQGGVGAAGGRLACGAGLRPAQVPVAIVLEQGHAGDASASQARQPGGLLGGAATGQQALDGQLRAGERRGQQVATHRLGDHGGVAQAEPAATEALGDGDAVPAEPGDLVPEAVVEAGLGGHQVAHRGRRRSLAAEGDGAVEQHGLFVAEGDAAGQQGLGFVAHRVPSRWSMSLGASRGT